MVHCLGVSCVTVSLPFGLLTAAGPFDDAIPPPVSLHDEIIDRSARRVSRLRYFIGMAYSVIVEFSSPLQLDLTPVFVACAVMDPVF